MRLLGESSKWAVVLAAAAPMSCGIGVTDAAPIVDLGEFPALAPRISASGEVFGVMHADGVAPRLVRWDSPESEPDVLATPGWLAPTRLAIGADGALVLAAWDTREAWRERPYLYRAGEGLVGLPHEGKFAGAVSLPAIAMGADGLVYGFGRLESEDQPVVYGSADELPVPVAAPMTGGRVESGFVDAGGGLVMSVSVDGVGPARTMRLDGEQWTDLGDPSASGEDGWMIARACEPGGVMVGGGASSLGGAMEPVRVTPGGAIESLGLLDGWIGAEALAVSGSGWVVGEATVFDEAMFDLRGQAFAWHESVGLVELSGEDGWTLLSATGISDDGWVVGIGVLDGVERAYAMRVPSAPSALVLGLGAMALCRRRRSV